MTALGPQEPPAEEEPFLQEQPNAQPTHDVPMSQLELADTSHDSNTASVIKRRLYLSHSLSTWNSRVFEFAAVLFLANLFPGDLVPASVYALVRAVSAICFAPTVGRYVDRSSRLLVVRHSIIGQRIAVILSCFSLWAMPAVYFHTPLFAQIIWLASLAMLACVEKLCSIMNLIAIERDWVVVIAENSTCRLEVLNSQMRRIDLACKLLGPLAIALVDGRYHLRVAVEVILGMNTLSLLVEYYAIADVYHVVPALRSQHAASEDPSEILPNRQNAPLVRRVFLICISQMRSLWTILSTYISHPVFLPSLALSMTYLTVLSFSGQMITYLVSVGLTSLQIGLLRTVSTALEMSATWIAPMAMKRVGPTRVGLWSINWQLLCTAAAVSSVWVSHSPFIGALGLVAGVILSRIGLWSFDLCVQIIVQEGVSSDSRGSFSSFEASLQNFFELCSYVSTIIFASSNQFQYPVSMSAASIIIASGLYATHVKRDRGHLVHLAQCFDAKDGRNRRREDIRMGIGVRDLT